MSYIAVVALNGDRVSKYQEFETEAAALAHVATHGGFAAQRPAQGGVVEWMADGETLSYSPPAPSADEVTAHAERLIEDGVTINITGLTASVYVQGRDKDSRNVQGLVTAAQLRLAAGDTTTVAKFRDGSNVMHDLTPAQVVELWQKSAAYVSAVYAASWAIKGGDSIAQNFADDERWPAPDQTA